MLERGFGFPESSLDVISQHHERLNGTGHPRGLKDHALHFFSKVVMVADAYDELCNAPELEKSFTPYQALSYLYHKREGEFWEKAVVALIRNLGVYPPSSIVELGGLTPTERKALRQHPETGRKMLERGFGFPESSLDVISQHHERLNGTGHPRGLKDHALHFFSKVVMVADAYDELCNAPELEKSFTPYQALSYLYHKREGEFWEKAVVALIRNLGVYPPSSIVELSDGSIGIVCTINLLDRMRPTVMLYASDIPPDEAKLVDLALEETLSIKQCLQPKDVPKRVWKYLNPRGMISYFAMRSEEKEDPSLSQSSAMVQTT